MSTSTRVYATYDEHSCQSLIELIHSLFRQQQQEWELLRKAVASLDSFETRLINCGKLSLRVQWNPQRLASVQARVHPDDLRRRPCFLCEEHLPEPQRAIAYRTLYWILCNPAPIFNHHCTVVTQHHTPQRFLPHLSVMLKLARDVDNTFTVLYNGPACGASAPDHFHFQLIPWRSLPVETESVDPHRRKVLHYQPHLLLCTLSEFKRSVIILESDREHEIVTALHTLIDHWITMRSTADEPLFNALCSYQQDLWRIIIFPRTKHRPDAFYKPESEQFLISPGVIDMGGVLIAPRQKEFRTLTGKTILAFYHEVSEPDDFVTTLISETFHQ
ncbi:MAG: DUF4922 domain-containing protein [Bacteroidetes bacterium]|nr:DUF4922 domain-containing protein [Bacteroidota bacterium]